ncbi:MAG: hypothetical protein PHV17_09325 [Candidatus Omnitrophica bacterium]|nr:hypothetical protein [Candidatus Omnitrophota bacterium]
MKRSKFVIAFLIAVFMSSNLYAATIILKSGRHITGKIVEDTANYLRVMNQAGYIKKYSRDEIQKVIRDNQLQVESQKVPLPERVTAENEVDEKVNQPLGMKEAQSMIEKSIKSSVDIMDKAMDEFKQGVGN